MNFHSLAMAVSDVRDYLLSVENDEPEARRIAERTAQSGLKDYFTQNMKLLTYCQNCSRERVLFWMSFNRSENISTMRIRKFEAEQCLT